MLHIFVPGPLYSDPDSLAVLQNNVTEAAGDYLHSCIVSSSRCLLLRERIERSAGRVMPYVILQLHHYLVLARPSDRKAFTQLMHSQHHLAVGVLCHQQRYRHPLSCEERLCRLCILLHLLAVRPGRENPGELVT